MRKNTEPAVSCRLVYASWMASHKARDPYEPCRIRILLRIIDVTYVTNLM
jgi:hypothetical protein